MVSREAALNLGTNRSLGRCWGRNKHRNFTWEGVVKVKMKAKTEEREHIRTHGRLQLRYFVDILISLRTGTNIRCNLMKSECCRALTM